MIRTYLQKIKIGAVVLLGLAVLVSCESAEDISRGLDHEVPACTQLTITGNGQTKVIADSLVSKVLWGYIPQTNLETMVLPTVSVAKGATLEISVVLSDNDALKTVELSQSDWLYSKYINFSNPEGDIPLTPKSYTLTAQVPVPSTVKTEPEVVKFYYNDGSPISYIMTYKQLTLTVVDVNMNKRTIPIFVKVE